MMDREFLSIKDIGELFQVTIRTVHRWRIEKKDFPKPIVLGERILRWKKSDILDWVDRFQKMTLEDKTAATLENKG